MKDKKRSVALIKLISSMLVFGTIGIFRRFIPLSSALLACLRGLIGGLFLVVCNLFSGKSLKFGFTRKQTVILCLTGFAIGINWMLLFESYNYTSVAISTVCYYMQPTFLVILASFILKEKLSLKSISCVFISVIGIVLVSGIVGSTGVGPSDTKGILLGLGAAILYAAVIILNKTNPVDNVYGKTIIQLISAAAILVPYLAVTEDFSSISLDTKSVVMILIVCIVHTGIAYALYFGSMNDLNSQTLAVMSYIDPIFAIILSAVFLKEKMTVFSWIGAVLVIGAAVLSELKFDNKEV